MLVVKSKDQFGAEILINPDKITYVISSASGEETTIFFDNDIRITIEEPFSSFKTKVNQQETVVKEMDNSNEFPYLSKLPTDNSDEYPDYLPRLPTGNVDKRTVQYKEYIANSTK